MDNLDQSAYEYHIELYNEYKENMEWTMKNGNDIKIKDMKDSHILNCIRMMQRKQLNGTRRAWIEIFQTEQLNRRKYKIDNIKNNIENGTNK